MTDKTKAITIFGAFLLIAGAVVYFGIIRGKNIVPGTSEENQANVNPNVPTKEFLESATKKTYDELKQESPNIVNAPNIYDPEVKAQFEEIAKSQNPENYFVVFDGKNFDPESITIFQGDLVTWRNKAVSDLKVKGAGDWGSLIPIETDQAFSQQFDYLGTYKYTAEANDQITGEVIVVAR